MTDDRPDPFAEVAARLEQRKREYWEELIDADDPEAVAKHDEFCAEADAILRRAHAAMASINAGYELTREAMTNIAIAYSQGDQEEVERLTAELEQTLGNQSSEH